MTRRLDEFKALFAPSTVARAVDEDIRADAARWRAFTAACSPELARTLTELADRERAEPGR